jgi:Fe-S-cluster-containing dehydrogenase component
MTGFSDQCFECDGCLLRESADDAVTREEFERLKNAVSRMTTVYGNQSKNMVIITCGHCVHRGEESCPVKHPEDLVDSDFCSFGNPVFAERLGSGRR